MSDDERDDSDGTRGQAVVLDVLPHGRTEDDRPQYQKQPVAFALDTEEFALYEMIVADDADGSWVRNSCLSGSGSNRDGVQFRDSADCAVTDSTVAGSGTPVSGAATTENVSERGSCPLPNTDGSAGPTASIAVDDATVSVTASAVDGELRVTVADDGPGIPEGELAPLDAGTETQLEHATGIGLWVVQWSVDALGGTLSFDTDDGTVVTVRLPDGPGGFDGSVPDPGPSDADT